MSKQYETVIGLETHVELVTKTKIFCPCSTEFGGAPNTHACPVYTGMSGSPPALNHQVVEYALAVDLATNCEINQYCKPDRRNYLYPDSSQNYQISQLYLPICRHGWVEIETPSGVAKEVGIHEIHMEENAEKLIHDEWEDCSLVDYNQSGVLLIEIVSEPDMRNAQGVTVYLEKLRLTIQYLGTSDCKLQEGSMYADVNLSVCETGSRELGTRTEMKSLNSSKAIARAIEGERKRQIEYLEEGKRVIQETCCWDDNKESSRAMCSKEDTQDYRYFPDLDLAPVVISDEWIAHVRIQQPELHVEKISRYMVEYDLPAHDMDLIISSKHTADLSEETVALCNRPKEVSNWLMVEVMGLLKEQGMDIDDIRFSPSSLAVLIAMVGGSETNRTVAKSVSEEIFVNDVNPRVYVTEYGPKVANDEGVLKCAVEDVTAANFQSVEDYKSGKERATGFSVGQTMRVVKGKADPAMVNRVVKEFLSIQQFYKYSFHQ